ncbi:MAG: glycosyltransferase [Saprospiraceae bacterium]
MDISIIIVSYNVKHFLVQCLESLYAASDGLELEIYVVDNHSSDDSVAMVHEQFPKVNLIANQINPGFAIANNQAIKMAKGKYILLLNPDTFVGEDTLRVCFEFMQSRPKAGAIGVKMIDGAGHFLPESKRGFPSPWVSFCKTIGLHRIFPKSPVFNGYYLGHLPIDETNHVDILSGAFMFLRSEVIDKVGLLDEKFFMYGEDIDLSYRITLAGFENFYLASTQIVHYKGESTRKGSFKYVRAFYQAMIIFARKHFKGTKANIFVWILQMAIFIRATASLVGNMLRKILLPVLDASLIAGGIFAMKSFWANFHYHNRSYFPDSFLQVNLPLYTGIWLISLWLCRAYATKYRIVQGVQGVFWGTIVIAFIYGFLPDSLRYSRMVVVLSAICTFIVVLINRTIFHYLRIGSYRFENNRPLQLALLGSDVEIDRIERLIASMDLAVKKSHRLMISKELSDTAQLDSLKRELAKLIEDRAIDEVIFCGNTLTKQIVMQLMQVFAGKISFRIASDSQDIIIASQSRDQPAELMSLEANFRLADPWTLRLKRIFDIVIAMIGLLTFPITAIAIKKRGHFMRNLMAVLTGKLTMVSYALTSDHYVSELPQLQSGVLSLDDGNRFAKMSMEEKKTLNRDYAKYYKIWYDLEVILNNINLLNRSN